MNKLFLTNFTIFTRLLAAFQETVLREEKNDLRTIYMQFLLELLDQTFGPLLQPKKLFTKKK